MLELLAQLEFKRQALSRKHIGGLYGTQGNLFGIAALVFFANLLPQIVAPPTAVASAPPEFVVVGALALLGFLCLATVFLAPLGFVFF
jgi:hypothetical protein